MLVDGATRDALAADKRIGRAAQAWIDAECDELERSELRREPRTLLLREVRERLGDSCFERSVYTREGDAEEEEEALCIWDLPDDF